jgi:predicted anti-sigma-YlaC factor YlaD
MKHLTDEQLIEHYLAEGANRVVVETHLRICSRCERVYEEISNAMEAHAPVPPARERGYGERVWQSIQGELLPYPTKPKRSYFSWPRLALAGACLLGIAAAFIGGSRWERSRTHPSQAANPARERERVVLIILDDHLDRSERLLVQLNHAGAEGSDLNDSLQAEARQLLPDNRLYRQSVPAGDDPIMTAALDHLERVLLEIANTPDKLNGVDITRIEQAMNTESLLFQIRVLRARTSRRAPKVESGLKGASI